MARVTHGALRTEEALIKGGENIPLITRTIKPSCQSSASLPAHSQPSVRAGQSAEDPSRRILLPMLALKGRPGKRGAPRAGTHRVDGQVAAGVGGGDAVEDPGAGDGPDQLGHDVEQRAEQGDLVAHEEGDGHSGVDVGAADVAEGLHQGADGQPEGQRDLQDAGQGRWPLQRRAQPDEDEDERGEELHKDGSGKGQG